MNDVLLGNGPNGPQIECHAPRTLHIPRRDYPLRANDSQIGGGFFPSVQEASSGRARQNRAISGTNARASAPASVDS